MMIKPSLLTAGLALALSAASAADAERDPVADAAEKTLDIGLDLAFSKLSLSCAGAARCSRVEFSPRVRLAYWLSPRIGVELSNISMDDEFVDITGITRSALADGVAIMGLLRQEAGPDWSVLLRAGLSAIRSTYRSGAMRTPAESTQRALHPILGVGLRWQFTTGWHVDLGMDWTRVKLRESRADRPNTRTLQSYGLGIGHQF